MTKSNSVILFRKKNVFRPMLLSYWAGPTQTAHLLFFFFLSLTCGGCTSGLFFLHLTRLLVPVRSWPAGVHHRRGPRWRGLPRPAPPSLWHPLRALDNPLEHPHEHSGNNSGRGALVRHANPTARTKVTRAPPTHTPATRAPATALFDH